MGFIIGQDLGYSTWRTMRAIATATVPTPAPMPIIGNHNEQWPVSPAYLRTIEGNGMVRIGPPASYPAFYFIKNTPPIEDFFYAEGFVEPYPEQLVGRIVTTTGSTFTITAATFTGGTSVGTGGDSPISVEWFQAMT